MYRKLVKVSATGNDFILCDLRMGAQKPVALGERPTATRTWCHRHEGVGADGAVFISSDPDCDFAWDFYNSDGSSAEMCGNAARAVSLYMSQSLGGQKNLRFRTRTGIISSLVDSTENIEVRLAPVAEAQWNQWSSNGIDQLSYDFVRAGVPHAVLNVPELNDRERLRALALEIKREPRFNKDGTNVTFVRRLSPTAIESVTFERGVEDFTLSCGTGAVAAAHSQLHGEENRKLEVRVPGGQLSVLFNAGSPQLSGPAKIIANIEWLLKGE